MICIFIFHSFVNHNCVFSSKNETQCQMICPNLLKSWAKSDWCIFRLFLLLGSICIKCLQLKKINCSDFIKFLKKNFVLFVGHNWGSEHDPSSGDCSPSSLISEGKYIMYPYSVNGYEPNNKVSNYYGLGSNCSSVTCYFLFLCLG